MKPTYWQTDPNKIFNLLNFFVVRIISSHYFEADKLRDLTSDYISVLFLLSWNVIMKDQKKIFTTEYSLGVLSKKLSPFQ